jgi:acetoacetyl-CoA reductase
MARVALVTGGTRGIGEAISRGLKDAGFTVAATYGGNDEAANKFKEETGIHVFKWDVGDFEACKEGIAKVEADLGPVDVLVNNAGITRDNLLLRMSQDQWEAVIRTNLTGTYVATHAVLRQMMRQRAGSIVSIASVIGLMGNPGQANYAASKAGVIGFTKTIAREVASRGIRVNAIAPGYIRTAMTDKLPEETQQAILDNIPLPRLGETEDVAQAVRFLCSDAASYITGVCLRVDGGMAI